jgi:hypothetical protein
MSFNDAIFENILYYDIWEAPITFLFYAISSMMNRKNIFSIVYVFLIQIITNLVKISLINLETIPCLIRHCLY